MKTLTAALCFLALSSAPALANPFSTPQASLDVMGTTMPSGITSTSPDGPNINTHIGVAIGVRFGRRIALMPLLNVIPKDANGVATIRPGLALVYGITKRVDIGIAEILRPEAKEGTQPGLTQAAPAIVLGIRL